MADDTNKTNNNSAIILALWAAVLVTVFVAFRSTDLLKLPNLAGNLGGGSWVGADLAYAAFGALAALAIGVSWFGFGALVLGIVVKETNEDRLLAFVRSTAAGAIVWSLLWFFLGLVGMYSQVVAIVAVVFGWAAAAIKFRLLANPLTSILRTDEPRSAFDNLLTALIAIPVILAFIASLAPPIAKDTLLYHFALPKAFISQGSSAFIDGNIASYLALGTEMHSVWAMLLGNISSTRAGEAAAGATVFLSFPLLLAAVFGWARQSGISRTFSLVAVAMVAAIPTAFHVASSGYVDLWLALYVTLAVYTLARWWYSFGATSLVPMAIFLGGALMVKLTAVFVIAAAALIVLLRARGEPVGSATGSDESSITETDESEPASDPAATAPGSDPRRGVSPGKIVLAGFGALLLAGVIASPWYLRNWAATGSPVFPFYMSIWKGSANGWDVERSNLFQTMNSAYGGADVNKSNYLMSPFRVSVAAQPENPELYDGVLGAAFLIGLPLVIWAFWKKKLADEFAIAAGVAVIVYFFWLFSSPQLRYLLPIAPLIAIAIVGAIEALSVEDKGLKAAGKYSLVAASFVAMLTSVAWFCQKAPLRVVLGGESRDQYLARNLDYYPYYQAINSDPDANAKTWLINMRRDTYHIDRPVFSDYLFEDWTLRQLVWDSRSTPELKAKAAALGVKYILTRHDFLFAYDKSALVDDKKPRAENEAKLKMARELILDQANTIKADNRFSLVRIYQ
jgi:hypothetical protein